jgi:hypothetical protein
MRTSFVFRSFSSLMVFSAMVGCAQMPVNDSGVSISKDFPACGVKIEFSGQPKQIPVEAAQEFTKLVGNYGKFTGIGWTYSKYRLSELSFCLCRDSPLTDEEFEKQSSLFDKPPATISDIGESLEFTSHESVERKIRLQLVRLNNAPSCLLVQYVLTPESINTDPNLFSSLALISPAKTAPKGDVADRLRLLDKLLKDKLISQEEYNKRRIIVLELL